MSQSEAPNPGEGYLAAPSDSTGQHSGTSAPGVLVLHAWWGLNDFMRELCDRLAAEGFVAYAPDLYGGRVASTIEEAEGLSSQLDGDKAEAEVGAAADWLRTQSGTAPDAGYGVIGFSLGGWFALNLAAQDPHAKAVVLFYGTGDSDMSGAKASVLGHFGDADPYEEDEWVTSVEDSIRDAGLPVTFHKYAAGHWFFESDRSDAYDAAAAEAAWNRTLDFLRRTLDDG